MLLVFVFFLASFISGTLNPTFVRFGVVDFPPIMLTFLRFLGAVLILLPFYLKRREKVAIKDLIFFVPFAINVALFSIGIQFTSLTMAAILYVFVPILVAIFGFLFMKDRLLNYHIIGLILSVIGVGILTKGAFDTQNILHFGTPLGNGILALAVVAFSLHPLSVRKLSKKYTHLPILFYTFVVTTALLVLVVPLEWSIRPFLLSSVTMKSVGSLLGLIVLSSTLYYFLYQWLIKNSSPFIASLMLYVSVLFSAVAGVAIFNEKITTELLIGALLVLAGVFCATTYPTVRKSLGSVLQ